MSELPYAGEEPFAYVSYARKDRNECILAIKHLHALGYRVFYDADIEEERLRAAESMIVLVSPCACDSDEVKDEIQLANKANKVSSRETWATSRTTAAQLPGEVIAST